MNNGRIISIVLILAGLFAIAFGIYTIATAQDEVASFGRRIYMWDRAQVTRGVIFLITGIACIGIGIYIKNKDEKTEATNLSMQKKCPFCANEIKKEAVICQFCGKDLPVKEENIEEHIIKELKEGECEVTQFTDLRKGPDKNQKYIWTLEPGEVVELIRAEGNWSFVKRKNSDIEGWCLSSSLREG